MLTVSNYHYIRPDFETPFPSIFGMTPSEFEKHLIFLSSKGTFIHPDEFRNDPDKILSSPRNFILITFDDGLREQYEFALKILDSLKIPALFFINSINHTEKKVSLVHKIHLVRAHIDPEILLDECLKQLNRPLTSEEVAKSQKFYRFDKATPAIVKYILNILLHADVLNVFINRIFKENFNETEVLQNLYMNRTQISELVSRGYIGSHTHSHLPLAIYDEEKIGSEFRLNNDFLKSFGLKSVDFVAYPYGTTEAASEKVAELAAESGHRFGFTTVSGINKSGQNHHLLNRFDCNDLKNINNNA